MIAGILAGIITWLALMAGPAPKPIKCKGPDDTRGACASHPETPAQK